MQQNAFNVSTIFDAIHQMADFSTAERWDNVGLLVGHETASINAAVATIEVTGRAIDFALEKKANLLITHHPLMFDGVKQLNFSSKTNHETRLIHRLIKNDINLITAHTNFDRAPKALHHFIFDRLGLHDHGRIEAHKTDENLGYGLHSMIKPVTIKSFIEQLKALFDFQEARLIGDPQEKITRVGFMSGSGAYLIDAAVEQDIDLYITGDIKYHDAVKASELGVAILDIGHFHSEKLFCSVMKDWLSQKLPGLRVEEFIGEDPFQFV